MFRKNFNLKILFFIIFIIFFIVLLTNSNIQNKVKPYLSQETKQLLKDTIFIYSTKKKLEENNIEKKIELKNLRKENIKLRYQFNFLENLYSNGKLVEKVEITNIGKRHFNSLKKFKILNSNKSNYKLEEDMSGLFYLERYQESIFINFSNGNLFYFNETELNEDKLNIKNINNNIKTFLDNSDETTITSRIRDSKVIGNKLFLSYAKKIFKQCFNTSIIYSEINLNDMDFKEFFTYPECVPTKIGVAGTGGRIEKINNDKILLTIGDLNNLYPSQDPNSLFGKTLMIDLNSAAFKIVTMGHKNHQGLVYSARHNLIFSSEHQGKGGDEINLLKISNDKIFNYGWAISSYGDHYDYISSEDRKKYPLYKSHSKYGFEEPLIFFNPAIAPSELIIDHEEDNEIFFILSTLKDKSLIELVYNIQKKKMTFIKTTKIGERIRDILNSESYLLISLENTPYISYLTNE